RLRDALAEALRRAADAEAAAEAARATLAPAVAEEAAAAILDIEVKDFPAVDDMDEALRAASAEREALSARLAERDQKIARLQREVADKTDRLGRLAKEMGELKARGSGKLFG
ncbi:hypothetical protein, partial [Anaeromyxobacter sp. SG66]|uniref:hypothetical protein n=2 Tax=unclassified Anaeromyxobacter TaxID=2620896 RepID=UPI001F5A02F2